MAPQADGAAPGQEDLLGALSGSLSGSLSPARGGATISGDGLYRYELWRSWDKAKPICTWVMLNPSTADATADDPTIRRCVGFARGWGYGGIAVVNLFAWRAKEPRELLETPDPVGPDNEMAISNAMCQAGLVVVAWGAAFRPDLLARGAGRTIFQVAELGQALNVRMACLGRTRSRGNQPRHPLYVPRDARLEEWP